MSSHIRVCLWSCCFLTMTCFGVPFPSVCGPQDKQLGDVSPVSYICHSESNVFFWRPVYGYWFGECSLASTRPPASYLLSPARPSHLLGDCFPQTRAGEPWQKKERLPLQTLSKSSFYPVCFWIANIISTLLIFNVPKKRSGARWQVLVEGICCLWAVLTRWEGLYDALGTRLNGRIQGQTLTGSHRPDTWHWNSQAAGHINTRCSQPSGAAFGSVYNMTLMKNVMKRQSYSYWSSSSLWETIQSALKVVTGQGRDARHGQGLGMSAADSLTSVIEMQGAKNCIRIKCRNYFNADRRSSCQGKQVDR